MTPTNQVQYTDKERHDPRTCGVHTTIVPSLHAVSSVLSPGGVSPSLPSTAFRVFSHVRPRSGRVGSARLSRIAESFGPSILGQVAFDPEGTLAFDGCDSAASTKIRIANPKLPEFYRGMSIIGNSFSSICIRHRT
ncbi:hypothetical protein K0M31_016426, partial [Melipona bicolor]